MSITEISVPEVTQFPITHHASTSSHPAPQDRWSRDKHIELVNIIGEPTKGMLTRSMDAKLTAASSSEYLFTKFLSEIEPKKVFEARNIQAISSKWVFRNKKDELGTMTRNKVRLVAQGYSKEEGIDYDETFTPVARMEAIRIFLAFATYMNFKVFHMDVKSAILNGKLKEEVYVKQPPSFKSSEFPDYVCKLDKALYGPKKAPRACSLVKTPMVPPNNLGLDLADIRPIQKNHISFLRKEFSDYACCNTDKKAPQVPVNCLEANWFIGVQRKSSQWLCPLLRLNPNPPTDESKVRPLNELIIKFTVKNGKTPLILDYKKFCQTTGLEYNNGNYVVNHSTKEVKAKLAKISNHEALCLIEDEDFIKRLWSTLEEEVCLDNSFISDGAKRYGVSATCAALGIRSIRNLTFLGGESLGYLIKGKLGSFVSFREMITSQLQGKLWLYDKVRTRLCLFCHQKISGIRACALRNFDLEDIIKKNSIFTRKRWLLWLFQTLRRRVSDDEDEVEPILKVEKKTVIPTATKKDFVKPKN
ncbi:retrovirus-related pol polyprotein from transposon TNT 1-94 [Tanacetum coccineum]|uniref:Retrovirus-related pol polyprotein from transposon TNT 1-94 n=1 Tax=Tanacetum coccineum TaxID=301880 RepID=A0ABQ5CVC2_9ASTR